MELEQYWQFGAALVFVLALIGVLFWVIQKVGFGGGKGRRGGRLGIVEAAVVDKRRRLVLIRRDSVEHLVMIGGPQDVVVENNITRSGPTLSTETTETTEGRRDNGPDFNIRPGEQVPLPTGATLATSTLADETRLADDGVALPVPQTASLPETDVTLPPEHIAAPTPEADPVIVPARPQEPPPPSHKPLFAPEDPVAAASAADVVPKPDAAPARPQEPQQSDEVHRPEEPHKAEETVRPEESLRPEEPRRPAEPTHPAEPTRPAAPARPWPPSEGRFREAQRRFAERSDYHPPGRGAHAQSAAELSAHYPPERQVATRAVPDGMPPPERPREASQESPQRTPANINVRPGED